MSFVSWSGDSNKKTDIRTWSLYPFLSSVNGKGLGLENLSTLQVSSINGFSFPQDDTKPTDWSLYPMISSFSGKGFSITDLSTIQISSINGFSFPQDDTKPTDWSLYPMISSYSGKGFSIRDLSTLQVSSINGFSFPQDDRKPIDWSLYPMISSFSGKGFSIRDLSTLQVSSINGFSFPQDDTKPIDWSLYPMISSFSGNNFSITTLANLQTSTVNGFQFPQVIPPPPADNTSNWATFFARADIDLSNRSIVNLNQINGSVYPPPIPIQDPDRWAFFRALKNVDMNQFNLNNAYDGTFTNQLTIGGIFQTLINNGDITCDNITVGNPGTSFADLNVYGVNLPPADSALFVQGGTTLDGGGSIHGITIGTLPVSGVNTQRVDVLPTGITVTTPTIFTVLGAGAISLNVGGAGNFAVGGALSLAGGAFIEMNSSNVRLINTSAGNENTVLNVSRVDGPFNESNQYPLIVGNSGSAGTELVNITFINGQPYPGTPGPSPTPAMLPTQTFMDIKPNGTNGGDGSSNIGNYYIRMLNTGNPALLPLSPPIFESQTIPELRLETTSGLISIPPGTYLVDVFCPVTSVGRHRCRIFDVSNGIELAKGNNCFTSTNSFDGGASTLSCVISVFTQISIEIQQQIEFNNGFIPIASLGLADVFGDNEGYTSVRFVRMGDPSGVPPTPPEPSNQRTWTGYMSPFFDLLPDTESAQIENLTIFNVFMGPTPQIPGRQSGIAYPLETVGDFICIVIDGGWEKTVIMQIQKVDGVGLIFRSTTTQFRQAGSFPQWTTDDRILNQSIIPSMFEGGPPSEGPNQTGYAITGFTIDY